jgi:membrane protein YdbS with pleckstrin-like domain
MLALRAIGLLVPPGSAGILARLRGIVLILALLVLLIAVGLGLVELVALPFGGVSLAPGVLLGLFVAIAALGIVAAIGRRRRNRAAEAAGRPAG